MIESYLIERMMQVDGFSIIVGIAVCMVVGFVRWFKYQMDIAEIEVARAEWEENLRILEELHKEQKERGKRGG